MLRFHETDGGFSRFVATGLLLLLSAAPLSGCYLMHVAKGQLNMACSTISVREALQSGDLNDADKEKLRYVQRVRQFAERDLHLKVNDNYTTYLPGELRPITYVVTAAYRDRLEPVTWWFPIVGSVSYRGYFDREMAEVFRYGLAADGYDADLRTAGAYSTLGWFTDPVTPLMLDMGDGDLAMLIIHELAHGTVYAAGQTDFNESLAEFVGRQGATELMRRRHGAHSQIFLSFLDSIADGRTFDRFMRESALKLNELYAGRPDDLETARWIAFDGIRTDLEELRPRFKTEGYRNIRLRTLNNAVMVGYLAYADTEPFEQAFERADGDWSRFFDLVRTAAEDDRPTEKLRQLIRD